MTSPSTKPTDRREKLLAYQGIPSLRHYLIVSQSERLVEWFRRDGDAWKRFRLAEPNDALDLRELGATLALSEIYDGIAFGPIPDDDAGL